MTGALVKHAACAVVLLAVASFGLGACDVAPDGHAMTTEELVAMSCALDASKANGDCGDEESSTLMQVKNLEASLSNSKTWRNPPCHWARRRRRHGPPTPAPTPAPTLAPTPAPTPQPTPAPTPAPWGAGDYLFASNVSEVWRCPRVGSRPCMKVAGCRGEGDGTDQLGDAEGLLAVAGGDFLVVDRPNARVLRCPADGSCDCTVVAGQAGDLQSPQDVALMSDGRIVIADWVAGTIWKCSASGDGTCVRIVGSEFQPVTPTGVAVASDQSIVFTDWNDGAPGAKVYRIPPDGQCDNSSSCPVVVDSLRWPGSVRIAADGQYVVPELGYNRVQKCPDAPLSCITVAGKDGKGDGPQQLDFPRRAAVAADGSYLVADVENFRVQRCPAAVGDCQAVVVSMYEVWAVDETIL
mmetsp:Transcript_58233/g.147917  ORF Transcript_58233/g.147917 Transcript_58233/m.147917 type:complete len:410 (-) Transcript_58233:129-1358(-)